MSPPRLILFFVKAPLPGRVKTRLAAVLGDDAALELYRAFVLDMLDMLDRSGLACCICVDPPEGAGAVADWLGRDRRYLPQTGGDLGERMRSAFERAFAEGAGQAVLIGSDLPDLPAVMLHGAFGGLESHAAVIGPARDGGYYLIGFRRDAFLAGAFSAMPWGSGEVLDRTLEVLRRAGRTVHELPPWRDIDTVEDLRDLVRRSRLSAFAESRTMIYCATHRTVIPWEEHDGSIRP